MSFKNKVVIVTGSGSGMGEATAILFAEKGAHVVIVDCSEDRANATAEKCKKISKNIIVITADVSKMEDNEKIIKETINAFGKIDILINNAGTVKEGKLLDGTILNSYDTIMDTNLRSMVILTTLAVPHLVKTKGCIVNTSSVASMEVRNGFLFPVYSISKAGVDSFTKSSALELAPVGIRVNAVNPGPVNTNILINAGVPGDFEEMAKLTALKKYSEPKEVANLILYLASDNALSITGSCVLIDNGMSLV